MNKHVLDILKKQPLLEIQIPYTEDREESFLKLQNEFLRQIGVIGDGSLFYLSSDSTSKSMSIGKKRNYLYEEAVGIFVVQWDSDDWILDNGLELIINAIKSNLEADCITFEEYVNMDGVEYKSNHSIEYGDWEGDGQKELWDGFHFHRTPFMKSVIKTEIAKSVPVPHIRFGEDHQWAQALKPFLKTEVHIPEQIYRYIHNSTPSHERYGFDKDKT